MPGYKLPCSSKSTLREQREHVQSSVVPPIFGIVNGYGRSGREPLFVSWRRVAQYVVSDANQYKSRKTYSATIHGASSCASRVLLWSCGGGGSEEERVRTTAPVGHCARLCVAPLRGRRGLDARARLTMIVGVRSADQHTFRAQETLRRACT